MDASDYDIIKRILKYDYEPSSIHLIAAFPDQRNGQAVLALHQKIYRYPL